MSSGLNTEVEHRGHVYHVQTENAKRSGSAVETLILDHGEILVRMTAPCEEPAARGRALEVQHWGLVRKIQNGMLDDKDEVAQAPGPDAEVRELLVELDQRLDEIFTERQAVRKGAWWKRHLGRVSVVVRW